MPPGLSAGGDAAHGERHDLVAEEREDAADGTGEGEVRVRPVHRLGEGEPGYKFRDDFGEHVAGGTALDELPGKDVGSVPGVAHFQGGEIDALTAGKPGGRLGGLARFVECDFLGRTLDGLGEIFLGFGNARQEERDPARGIERACLARDQPGRRERFAGRLHKGGRRGIEVPGRDFLGSNLEQKIGHDFFLWFHAVHAESAG